MYKCPGWGNMGGARRLQNPITARNARRLAKKNKEVTNASNPK
jgi:hypothetical protein